MKAFTRQLAYQPGIQLNPIQDRTDGSVLGVFDQTAAIIGRFQRGRIDKPFRVNRGTLRTMLGKPQSITLSLLNEAYSHVYEALQRGAREVVVQRLSVPAAVTSWVVFTSAAVSTFAVAATPPGGAHTFAVRHLGCHSDGIIVRVNAEALSVAGVPTSNPLITVVIADADGNELYRIKGSLTAGSVDEFEQSNYLPDVSALYTDELVWSIPTGGTIAPTHNGYGKDATGYLRFATSPVLIAFTDGGSGYGTDDYDRATTALRDSQEDYGYIMGGGTRAIALITRLADLAYETNRQFVFDIPGELTPAAAITFAGSLGFGALGKDHYPQAYWAPLMSLDPANGNSVVWGTSGAQVGMRCARNAVKNAYGLAAKNSPIAMKNGILQRPLAKQMQSLSEQQLSDLALARINPVTYTVLNSGGVYCFTDSLTCAATLLSYRKLVSVAEMSAHIDESVARYGRELLQLPQKVSIDRMNAYLERLFSYALASGWLVESTEDPDLPPYAFEVMRDPNQPADRLMVRYWLHYDGVTRQIEIQQSIV